MSLTLVPRPGDGGARAQTEKKSVLILHSYHHGYKWTDDIAAGILDGLATPEGRQDLDLQVEYMDTKRLLDKQYLQQLADLYAYKFRNHPFDVIISSDDDAFNFLLERRDELFPGTPVVFCGVNFFREPALGGQKLFTGVNEEADIKGGLDLALRLHPQTRYVAVVNDPTTTGRKIHDVLTQLMPAYRDRVQFLFLEQVNMQDVEATLKVLPPNSLVYYTLFFRDKSGAFFEYDESIRRVVAASPVPVYGTWDFSLGYGIVGGMLASGYYQGETAAQLALRILAGESADDIPVIMASPNRYMFDYQQLRRFNVPLADLPEDSIIINRPLGFYERYRGWLWGGAAMVAFFLVVIVVLASLNVRRRRAEEVVRQTNVQLQESRDLLEQRVAERTMALDRRSQQLEAAAHVARDAAAIRNLATLLQETVQLISEHMGFYHAGLFLLDEAGEYAVLRAASSEGGQQMLAHEHRLPVGRRGIVGRVAATGQPRIALDVGHDAVFFDNPYLPRTRSEVAVPLISRGRIVGVLDVQSTEAAAFGNDDLAILETLADQVALAIENARLLEETQDRLREISVLAGEQARTGWTELTTEDTGLAYMYDGVAVSPQVGSPQSRLLPAAPNPESAAERGGAEPVQVTVPLQAQNQVIGHLGLSLEDRAPSPEEMEMAQAVADRVSQALERARLFREAQRRAARDRLLTEVTGRMRQSLDLEAVLRAAAEEMRQAMGLDRVVVRLQGLPGNDADPQGGDGSQEGNGHA